MDTVKQIELNRMTVVAHIKDNSTCINDLKIMRKAGMVTRYQLRAKAGGKVFVLITHDNGERGFEIYYPEQSNFVDTVLENFDKY